MTQSHFINEAEIESKYRLSNSPRNFCFEKIISSLMHLIENKEVASFLLPYYLLSNLNRLPISTKILTKSHTFIPEEGGARRRVG